MRSASYYTNSLVRWYEDQASSRWLAALIGDRIVGPPPWPLFEFTFGASLSIGSYFCYVNSRPFGVLSKSLTWNGRSIILVLSHDLMAPSEQHKAQFIIHSQGCARTWQKGKIREIDVCQICIGPFPKFDPFLRFAEVYFEFTPMFLVCSGSKVTWLPHPFLFTVTAISISISFPLLRIIRAIKVWKNRYLDTWQIVIQDPLSWIHDCYEKKTSFQYRPKRLWTMCFGNWDDRPYLASRPWTRFHWHDSPRKTDIEDSVPFLVVVMIPTLGFSIEWTVLFSDKVWGFLSPFELPHLSIHEEIPNGLISSFNLTFLYISCSLTELSSVFDVVIK